MVGDPLRDMRRSPLASFIASPFGFGISHAWENHKSRETSTDIGVATLYPLESMCKCP